MKLLPHYFKYIGLALAIFGVLFNPFTVFLLRVMLGSSGQVSLIYDHGLSTALFEAAPLIGLLLIILSRQKIEDERVSRVRMESFQIAFVFGAVITSLFIFMTQFSYGFDQWNNMNRAMGLGSFFSLQFLCYIIAFYTKKGLGI